MNCCVCFGGLVYAHVRCKGNLVCVNESFCHVSSGWISSSGGHTRLRYMILALRLTYALRARLHIMRHNELEWIYGWNVGPFLAALQYFVRQMSVFTGLACCTGRTGLCCAGIRFATRRRTIGFRRHFLNLMVVCDF